MGGKCTTLKSFSQIGSKVAICSKQGKKQIWALATPSQKFTFEKKLQEKRDLENLKKANQQLLNNLQEQKEEQLRQKLNLQSRLTKTIDSINVTNNNLRSLQMQISKQQDIANTSQINTGILLTTYNTVKAQAEILLYASESASRDNSIMLAAKVLCDFGFGSCGIYSDAKYN